jgi:glycosyltransferase involved in cell wall biosynthesis
MPQTVSVIIPTRDRASLLREALASVRAVESLDMALDVIVVDNGSSDDSREVARSFGARVLEESQPGPSPPRNAGLRAARGEFVAFLDDDDVWTPDNLRPQLDLMLRRPDFDAAAGRVQLTTSELRSIGEPYPAQWPQDGDLVEEFFHGHPQLGSLVVRTRVRETVGFFDEHLVSSEDWDWCMRLALNHKVGFVPVTSVMFRQRTVGTHDDLQWIRFKSEGSTFWRNVRRAKNRRPSAATLIRIWLRARGGYYSYFARSAVVHGRAGDRAGLRRCVSRAAISSPLHAVFHAAAGGEMRTALGFLMRPPQQDHA